MAPYEWRFTNAWTPWWTITVNGSDVTTADWVDTGITYTLSVRRGDEEVYRQTRSGQSREVARQLALEGILFVVGQLLGENQWVQAFMLLWEAVKVAMMLGRWVSASQGVDGKQLVRGLLDLAMEGAG